MLYLPLVYLVCTLLFSHATFAQNPIKLPYISFDEFFNSVSFPSVKVSPDGASVVIETERADWEQQIYREDLWLYRASGTSGTGGTLIQLTQSGYDTSPQWSPDGQWIAFLSERNTTEASDASDTGDDEEKPEKIMTRVKTKLKLKIKTSPSSF